MTDQKTFLFTFTNEQGKKIRVPITLLSPDSNKKFKGGFKIEPEDKFLKIKKPHDWRPFIKVTGEQVGPFSATVYCLAFISKQDFRAKKGPPGAIIYGEEPDKFSVGFLKSEFATLETDLKTASN